MSLTYVASVPGPVVRPVTLTPGAGVVSVVNQWAATFAQPATFQTMPPALQSVNVPLTVANSAGGGSGVPSAGNWLVAITGMNEQATTAGFTVGAKDDIHSYWRPAKISASAALTRTSVWYTANLQRAAGTVYISPNGAFDALSVLVVEISGAGPWDTLTVTPASNYAAAATSLALSLGAPSASSFAIAAVTGDSTTATQAFAPGGWTALHTVSASNGVDHTCDCVLTSAFLSPNSGSLSVSASAGSATDLSGVILEWAVTGTSPIPSAGQGQNPNWAYCVLEAAFGSGYETPEELMVWTSLNDIANSNVYRRFWAWDDSGGVPYALGQLQSGSGSVQLDNADGLVSPLNPASLHYTSAAGWAPLAGFYDPLVLTAGPLAWWKLADASGSGTAADSSGNSHPGTATSVTFGNTNEAVTGNTSASFASGSTSHIISSYNPSFAELTVECWVNLNGLTQSGNPRLIASSHTDADSRGFQLYLDPTPHIYIGFNPGTANVKAARALSATGWNHLAATYDGTVLSLYVNGVLAGTATTGGTISTGTAAGIGLGYGAAYAGDYLNGLLSEAAVYGTALTSQQVAAHFTAGPAGTGTPVRTRLALGTIAGVTYNRWYTWTRNALAWPEKRNKALRGYVPVTLTDAWSVMSGSCPTPYRGEVEQDNPYAWWPCDDQPLSGGVQPTSLRNAALGNANVLNIVVSPNGTGPTNAYATDGTAGSHTPYFYNVNSGVAVPAVGQNQGWMYGDPQSSPQSYATSNPVTSNPGSASWQTTGQAGNTGADGWFLSCNDAGFPPLSGGVTVEGWFNYLYFGTTTATNTFTGGANHVVAQQPDCPLTLWAATTNSAPVAILQLDTTGALSLITYNGTTPTSHSVYTTTDLRDNSWHHYAVALTTTTWAVYVDGGLTAKVSGSGVSMTSAWTWLIGNGDMGNTSGGGTTANIQHSGNVSISHLKVYPSVLPNWRVLARYCAAVTGFGVLPAPTGTSYSFVNRLASSLAATTDGQLVAAANAQYGLSNAAFSFSAVVVAQAGSFTSGPSASAASGSAGVSSPTIGYTTCISWGGVAPQFAVYTATSVNAETQASVVSGTEEDYQAGYGAGATGYGVSHVSGGSGASPPASPSSLGDSVAQRIERILGYAMITAPNRAVDSTASLLVQAAADIGGQQAGANIQNLTDSDNGLLIVDSNNTLCYKSRTHLAADTTVWFIGMNTIAGMIPFDDSIEWSSDPQRVWDAITVTPYSPDGASLASLTPAAAAAANAAQAQFGVRPKQVTSYLQDATKQQAQADWFQSTFGLLARRASVIAIDAASHPKAWGLVAGANPGDIAQIYDAPLGQVATTGVYRISQYQRSMSNGANGAPVQARIVLVLDPVPASYWS